MLFNSLDFLGFFILVFGLYWSTPSRLPQIRNGILLVASYFFYGYWDWRFLILIAVSTLVDFVAGQRIYSAKKKAHRKVWLGVSLIVNLGLLGFFKYFNFFVDSFVLLLNSTGLEASPSTLNIILPVGISFYTFQTLSYSLDIYRNSFTPTPSLLRFATFVAFFPQLVAGPIERAASLLPQFNKPKTFDYSLAVQGMLLMVYGFFKKIAIADNLAPLVDPVYTDPSAYHNWEVALALVGFGFQIYADFSGYSDIAIGLAAVFGFHLNTNFRSPYASKSLREFWTKWHISLYSWFRDYVYIPLGGSRKGPARRAINVIITFGLSGLWHGAGFNYIAFGLIHGGYYVVEKNYLNRLPKWAIHFFSLIVVMFAWGVFRTYSYADFSILMHNLLVFDNIMPPTLNSTFFIILASMSLFLFLEHSMRKHENFTVWLIQKPLFVKLSVMYLVVFWTLIFGAFNTAQNFIYFQF